MESRSETWLRWLGVRVKSLTVIALLVVVFADAAGAATTRIDEHGTTLVDGRKVFPIVLAKGPEGDALDEVVTAGVNFLKVGPATRPWWPEDIADAMERNREAAARGVYTWVNLATLSDADPGSLKETRIREVITALEEDPSATALALWKGADEPWWAGFPPAELQFAYCIATSRGPAEWCAGRPVGDSEHLWVTIQAPKGTAADLAPYSAATDIHGVDHYPVTFTNPDPDLHEVGTWTETIRSVTSNGAVWTTLQVCASGSSDPNDGSKFVLPTKVQERYMIYDAILNGARSLAFYGGNLDRCWNATDADRGWNWTFWDTVLEDLVREINAESPIAPALVNPGSTKTLESTDPDTQVISREGAGASDLWVIAARDGAGTAPVTITGLPAGIRTGTVYTEGRSVDVTNGSFTDTFSRWGVHVYRFAVPPPPPPPPPAPPPPAEPPAPPPVVTTTSPTALRSASASSTRRGRLLSRRVGVVTNTGERVTSGTLSCGARVRGIPLRVVGKGWQRGSASCTWRVPKSFRGKVLRGVVRVDSRKLSLVHRFTTRVM
jgi:hypothetical protein